MDVRIMIRKDLAEVVRIESLSYNGGWTEEDFLKMLRLRYTVGMVMEHQQTILGYMIYELHLKKLKLLNLTVHPIYRTKGIGTNLIDKLKSKLSHDRRPKIQIIIRETNLVAQLFLKGRGFQGVRVLRNYFEEEDAFVMKYLTNREESYEQLRTEVTNRQGSC